MIRTGIGVDVHAFGGEGDLALAGLTWPGEQALSGHSDGDVAAHAAADAIVSAAGLGDLGAVVGVGRPEWTGASGVAILAHCAGVVREAGWTIENIAIQVIGNRPKIGSRRDEAQAALSQAAGADVSIAGTTSDGLGLTGRGEGIAAIATALLTRD